MLSLDLTMPPFLPKRSNFPQKRQTWFSQTMFHQHQLGTIQGRSFADVSQSLSTRGNSVSRCVPDGTNHLRDFVIIPGAAVVHRDYAMTTPHPSW